MNAGTLIHCRETNVIVYRGSAGNSNTTAKPPLNMEEQTNAIQTMSLNKNYGKAMRARLTT